MERTSKTWGEKYKLFQNDLCEVSILYLNSGQRCSWHQHRTKFNQFYVIEGELCIKLDNGVDKVESCLTAGEVFTTNPDQLHEFRTYETAAVVQEIMYVQYNPEDIQRELIGGPLNEQER
jgi:quercetin dioxygenase-like cupin family protein